MKKMIFSIIAALSLMSSAQEVKTCIEFQGEKKALIVWVGASLLDHNHPFSVTSVIRYKDNTFVLKGDIVNLDEQEIQEIGAGNCVYFPFYTKTRTRLSGSEYQDIGAIVLGSKDPEIYDQLFLAANFNLIHQQKK